MADYKPTIVLDFDGVIHSYTSGWKGADVIPDPPVEGAFDFLEQALTRFNVAIFSSRTHQDGGVAAMQEWFRRHGFPLASRLEFPDHKPPALVTIDDRAIRFTGVFPSIGEVATFKTWQQLEV